MKKLIIFALGVVILLATVACASGARTAPNTAPSTATAPAYSGGSIGERGAAPAPSISVTIPQAPSSVNQTASTDRMVVRTGNIDLVVSNVADSIDNITKISADFGGYVVTSQKWKEGERNIGTISIRVLAENYDKTIAALRGLAISVISESTSTQDVTEEYTDLESRVKNLEATEAQLQKIMLTATKTEDVLSIQRELTNVRGEIEKAKGRLQYLQRTSDSSLIQIKLKEAVIDLKFSASKVSADVDEGILFTAEVAGGFAPYNYQWDFGDGEKSVDKSPRHSYKNPGTYTIRLTVTDDKGYTNSTIRNEYIDIIGSWNPGSIARSAWNGFMAFGRVFVNILIWLGIFSPIWIVIGVIVGWRIYRKKKSRKTAAPGIDKKLEKS